MVSNEGQGGRRRRPAAPAPRGGRGGNYVTGQTASPSSAAAPGNAHYPTPAPQAVPTAPSTGPGAPYSPSAPPAPTTHPVVTAAASHPAIAALPPVQQALATYALAAAKTYGIKPSTLLGLVSPDSPATRQLTLHEIARAAAQMVPPTSGRAPLTPQLGLFAQSPRAAATLTAAQGMPVGPPGSAKEQARLSALRQAIGGAGNLPPIQVGAQVAQRGVSAPVRTQQRGGRGGLIAAVTPTPVTQAAQALGKAVAPTSTAKKQLTLRRIAQQSNKKLAPPGRLTENAVGFLDPRVEAQAKRFARGPQGRTNLGRSKLTLAAIVKAGEKKKLSPAARRYFLTGRVPGNYIKRAHLLFAGAPGHTIAAGKSLAGKQARRILNLGKALPAALVHQDPVMRRFYVDPFAKTSGLVRERVDQGKDFWAPDGQPINAIGKAQIVSIGAPGWPGASTGTNGVTYRLLQGPHAGQEIFVRESMVPTKGLKVNQIVQRGQQIAAFDSSVSGTGIEMGFVGSGDAASGVATPYPGPEASLSAAQIRTPGGRQFARFYHKTVTGDVAKGNINAGAGAGAVPNLGSPAVQHAVAHTTQALGVKGNPRATELVRAAVKYGRQYGVSPALIVGISKVESGVGTSTLPGVRSGQNPYGAAGPMQMGNGTGASGDAWQTYSQKIWGSKAGQHSVYNIDDAVHAAALYLKEAGADMNSQSAGSRQGALAYNHSTAYADQVQLYAKQAQALENVSGRVGPLGAPAGSVAATVAAAAASGRVPLGSAGAIAQALQGAPASVQRQFAQARNAAQAKARLESRARGYITPPTGVLPTSPLAFGFGGDYASSTSPSGSSGLFRPTARRRSTR